MRASQHTGMEVPAFHLVISEINAVTSAIRKHVRNASSSSFLGGSSNVAGVGPIAGGSSAASLLRSAIASSSASTRQNAANGGSSHTPTASISAGAATLRVAHGSKMREDANAIPTPYSAIRASSSRNAYSDGRRDEGVSSLLHGFSVLRAQLRESPDLDSFPVIRLLSPFLRVILSPRTTGPITSIALQAVHRLLVYNIIRMPSGMADLTNETSNIDSQTPLTDANAVQFAVAEIAHAVSHCRFEASEAVADELVLLRILAVMRELICGDGRAEGAFNPRVSSQHPQTALADCLGDESICEMMETGLSMCCQMRLSDLLRRTAEQSMTTMVRALFSRLFSVPLTADETYSSNPNMPEVVPEHATLAAEPVGEDALEADREKKLRRMTMPDPQSRDVPAAAGIPSSVLQELKELGEQEESEEVEQREEGVDATQSIDRVESALEHGTATTATQERGETGEQDQSSTETVKDDSSPSVQDLPPPAMGEVKPFGLPAIKEVLRVIVSLLDPHNVQHTDAMRLLGLSMLNSVFEVAGRSIGRFPSLRAIVQDSACKYLFQLIRSDNSAILTYSLRTFSTLFETMKEHLKLQHELFISFLLDRLSPTFPLALEPWKDESANMLASRRATLSDNRSMKRAGTPDLSNGPPLPPPPPPMPRSSDRAPAHGETREVMLETLGLLLGAYGGEYSDSDTLLELWINYDCDVDCENIFEKVIHFLCRAVYANNPLHPDVLESSQLFAVDVLLNFLASMTARQEAEAMGAQIESHWPEGLPTADSLSEQKGLKASILAGAARFNAKPKDGLAYLESQGFIDTSGRKGVPKEVSIARFLKECPRLDKKLLGDYISRPDNIAILEAFLGLFDFTNKPIADAMREMLEAFRLPGESQQISRITETFAKIYFASKPEEIKSEDAVYILSYSVIMLNTDLHNPQNKRRMTVEDYRRNLRGVNDNADFGEEYLGSIYDSIRRREIVMPEEHVGQLGFEYTWKELLRRSRSAGNLLSATTTRFDQAMFEASWRPIMASIAHAFRTHKDEHILEREISGFRHCAILASRYGMIELFDSMCQGLASATGLLDMSGASVVTNNAQVEVEGQQVTVSPLSIQFGGNFKGQLAAVVLFTIANGNGNAIRKGWSPIFEIFKNLFVNSLLPPTIAQMFEFGQEEKKLLPLKPRKLPGATLQDPRSQAGSGLLSTISSYLLSPYSGEKEVVMPQVNDEEVESTLCTVDCVASCRTEELFEQILELGTEALIPALTTLVELANRHTIERRSALLSESDSASGRSTPVQGSGAVGGGATQVRSAAAQLPYDASAAFVLELATTIACSADVDSLSEAWSLLYEHLQMILSTPLHYHSLQIERAAVSVLRLINAAAAVDLLHDQLFIALDQLNSIPNEYKIFLAPQVVAGLHHIVAHNSRLIQSHTEWHLVLSLLQTYSSVRNALAANHGFEAIVFIARERLSEENFLAIVSILRDFGRAADFSEGVTSNGHSQQAPVRRTLTEKKELKEYEEACQARGVASIEILESLKGQVVSLSQQAGLPLQEAWQRYWKPLMMAIAVQYTNSHRGTRQAAITYLQRILLASELRSSCVGDVDGRADDKIVLDDLFYSVLFPTLHELLKPEVFQRDPSNESGSMQETRIRACNMLCKVFLHYLNRLTEDGRNGPSSLENEKEEEQGLDTMSGRQVDESFIKLWLDILDFFDRFMHSGKRDQLTEATPENLKNVLLVMHASGLLVPPSSAEDGQDVRRSANQADLFDKTFERIQRFLPRLKEELFKPQIKAS